MTGIQAFARGWDAKVVVVLTLLLVGGAACGGEPERARDPGMSRSWTYFPRYSSQFNDERVELLNLPTDRLRDLHPQRHQNVTIPICILPLQSKLRSHTTRIDNTQ
jgi:hypothetical protein